VAKEMITEQYGVITYLLEGTGTSVIRSLNKIIEEVGETFYIEKDYHYYDDDGFDLVGYYEREETDKEYEKRLAAEKKARDKKKQVEEERDRKEYERLKAKFEK
jgi:hypothetical protein